MDIVTKAKMFATIAHKAAGNKRKLTNEPYIIHPEQVVKWTYDYMSMNKEHVRNADDLIAIAWLHDTVEDTGVEIEDILNCFSFNICWGVDTLSADDCEGRERKNTQYIEKLNDSKHQDYLIVKLADIRANFEDIVTSHKNPNKEKQFKKYRRFIEEKIRMLKEVDALSRLNGTIALIDDMKEFLNKKDAA